MQHWQRNEENRKPCHRVEQGKKKRKRNRQALASSMCGGVGLKSILERQARAKFDEQNERRFRKTNDLQRTRTLSEVQKLEKK